MFASRSFQCLYERCVDHKRSLSLQAEAPAAFPGVREHFGEPKEHQHEPELRRVPPTFFTEAWSQQTVTSTVTAYQAFIELYNFMEIMTQVRVIRETRRGWLMSLLIC